MISYFVGLMLGAYPAYAKPQLRPLTIGTMITLTLLIGYELEGERLGEAAVTAMGQPYYPPYIMSWRNIVAVTEGPQHAVGVFADITQILAGVGIAFFWTVFPYPILDSQELPRQFGDAIFTLAELHMRVHMAVYSKISRLTGPQEQSENASCNDIPALERRMISELTALRMVLDSSQFEIHIANPFPRKAYEAMLAKLGKLFRSLLLIAYTAERFPPSTTAGTPSPWLRALREHNPSHTRSPLQAQITSALAACGTSLTRNHPLPPLIDVPDHSSLLQALRGGEMDLLDRKFEGEEGYEGLVTVHAAGIQAAEEVRELVELVGMVVGRMRFRFDAGSESRNEEQV